MMIYDSFFFFFPPNLMKVDIWVAEPVWELSSKSARFWRQAEITMITEHLP